MKAPQTVVIVSWKTPLYTYCSTYQEVAEKAMRSNDITACPLLIVKHPTLGDVGFRFPFLTSTRLTYLSIITQSLLSTYISSDFDIFEVSGDIPSDTIPEYN